MLFADGLQRELAGEVGIRHKAMLHILHDILGYRKIAARCMPMKFPTCNNVPAAPLSASAQEETTTLGGTELQHSS